MKEDFNIAHRIMVMGILEPYYTQPILAYAFDLPEEHVKSILDYYHRGARKAIEDSIRILIQDQGLTEEDIHELFSALDLRKEAVDKAIRNAQSGTGTELPDASAPEVYAEAYRTGYIFTSSHLFHKLKIRTESTIEEINALFSMNPDMDHFISRMSHTSDQINLEEQLFGTINTDDAFEALNNLAGPEVAARLNEYRTVGEFNRELRQLPEDIRYQFAEIILNDIIPMAKSKAPIEKIREAALKAITEAGLLGDTATNESEDGTE